MRTQTFHAGSAKEAVAKIREALGPSAVVLQVRKVRAPGLAGLLGRPRIEVVAALPEEAPGPEAHEVLGQVKRELAELRVLVERQQSAVPFVPAAGATEGPAELNEVEAFFLRMGLLPPYARKLAALAQAEYGAAGRSGRGETAGIVRRLLQQQWRLPPPLNPESLHILVGAPGVGKTTVLCKWLARLVLRENQSARVWCADGERPNLAETLRLHGELLGVPVARLAGGRAPECALRGQGWCFVDMPGLAWQSRPVLEQWRQRAEAWGPVQWHLVVSAAYDTALLWQQVRAFSDWPLAGVLVTHVDEQPALGKLWNLICGTNCSVRFLAGGQNIPGEFIPATPAALGPAILWAETALSGPAEVSGVAGKASAMQGVADWK